jgi:hypothetical protein
MAKVNRGDRVSRPTQAEYDKAEVAIALSWCPEIYACKKCGWPVIEGYCCTTCGNATPDQSVKQDKDFDKKYPVGKKCTLSDYPGRCS